MTKSYLLFAILSALLVIVGDHLVLQRTPDPPTPELAVGGDTLFYIRMIEGESSTVPGLYRYRILVPFIAKVLPFSPLTDLLVMSYAGLFVCYLLALLICVKLGLNGWASLLGLFSVYSSGWQLYYYHNPYLTDAFGLMALFVLFFALVHRSYLLFFAMGVLGVLARETTVFLVPLWLVTKQWRRSLLVMVASLVTLAIPRLTLLSSRIDLVGLVRTASAHFDQWGHLFPFLGEIFLSWGFLWPLALLGLFLIPMESFLPVFTAFLLLFIGAFLSCVFQGGPDIGRLFSILSPVMTIACAQVYSSLAKKSALLTVALTMGLIAQLFTGIPTVLTSREGWVFRSAHYSELFSQMPSGMAARTNWVLASYGPRLFVLAAGTCFSMAAAFILRDAWVLRFQEKVVGIRSALKREVRS